MAGGKSEKIFDDTATTASYQSVVCNILGYAKVLVFIEEVGASKSIYYKIVGRVKAGDSDSEITLKAETSISASGSAKHTLTDPYEEIVVSIKNNSGVGTVNGFVTRKRRAAGQGDLDNSKGT